MATPDFKGTGAVQPCQVYPKQEQWKDPNLIKPTAVCLNPTPREREEYALLSTWICVTLSKSSHCSLNEKQSLKELTSPSPTQHLAPLQPHPLLQLHPLGSSPITELLHRLFPPPEHPPQPLLSQHPSPLSAPAPILQEVFPDTPSGITSLPHAPRSFMTC